MRESRKSQSKDRAFVDLACDRNGPAVSLRNFLDDGKPESGTTGILRPCPISPIKPLEQMRQMLLLDPMTCILDSHSHPFPNRLQTDSDRSTRRRVVKRIVEQIDQRLHEPLCIPEDWWNRLGFKRQRNSTVIGKQGQFIHKILHHGFQRERHEVKGEACRL
jgi:hypothetical protein